MNRSVWTLVWLLCDLLDWAIFALNHTEFIAQKECAVTPNSAVADNRFSGIGTHSSLLTIQSIRMGLKFDEFHNHSRRPVT